MIELRLLGSLELRDGRGRPVRSVLAQPKRLALLAYLAAQRARFPSRDTLLGLFWPELDSRRARAALRQTLYHLRSGLGERSLVGTPTVVEVREEEVWSDAREFQSALAAGTLERALLLYRGDLLPGFFLSGAPAFERWLEDERNRLRQLAARAAWVLSDQRLQAGDQGEALHWARRALSIVPEDESSARRLMQRLDGLGDRSGALAIYEGLARRLAAEYQVDPAPETRDLADTIRARRTVIVDASAPGRDGRPPRSDLDSACTTLSVRGQSNDAQDPFTSGLTDEIAQGLSTIQGLRLIGSPLSATAFGGEDQSVAERLGVRYLLSISVQREGPEIDLQTRLLDARSRRTIWSESRTVPITQLGEIRQSVVARVGAALGHGHLPERESPVQLSARESLLSEAKYRARQEMANFTEQGFDRAIVLMSQALQVAGDDDYVLTTLGQAHLPHIMLGTRAEEVHLAQAEWCAERSLGLNPESVRGRVLRGLARLRRGNARGCAADLKAALEADPNNRDALFWLTLIYVISGRGHQASPLADRLLAADPLNSTNQCVPGYIEAHRGFFEDARPHYEAMYRMEPENLANRWCYTQLLIRGGRGTEACALLESIMADAPDSSIARQARVLLPALQGRRAACGRAMTDRLRREARWDEHGSWWLACALSLAGETEEALPWLENAVRLGYIDEPFLARIDPCLEPLRGLRRFTRVMEQARRAYDEFDQ